MKDYIDKAFNINAKVTASQCLRDAAASTFGSDETAAALDELGFFAEASKQPKNLKLVSVNTNTGISVFSFDENQEWIDAVNKVIVKNNKTKETNITSFLNKRSSTELWLTGNYIEKLNYYKEYTETVTFQADGYDDVVVDVTWYTNP